MSRFMTPIDSEFVKNFSEDQPRDEKGQWTDTEGTQAEADREVKRTSAEVEKAKAALKAAEETNPVAKAEVLKGRLAEVDKRIAKLKKSKRQDEEDKGNRYLFDEMKIGDEIRAKVDRRSTAAREVPITEDRAEVTGIERQQNKGAYKDVITLRFRTGEEVKVYRHELVGTRRV